MDVFLLTERLHEGGSALHEHNTDDVTYLGERVWEVVIEMAHTSTIEAELKNPFVTKLYPDFFPFSKRRKALGIRGLRMGMQTLTLIYPMFCSIMVPRSTKVIVPRSEPSLVAMAGVIHSSGALHPFESTFQPS